MKQPKKAGYTRPNRSKQKKEQAAIAYWHTATYSIENYQWSNSENQYYWNDYVYVPNKPSKLDNQ